MSRSLVKVFCMTKNEYDLIEDFIVYYGYLFGYSNIVLIDNLSTDPRVLDIYAKYQPLGVIIHSEASYAGNSQGDSFTKYMQQYKDQCEFVMGLDTDEFIYSVQHLESGENPVDRENIRSILRTIPSDVTICQFETAHQSIVDPTHPNYVHCQTITPARSITTFKALSLKSLPNGKNFYRSDAFIITSCGNHLGQVSYGRTDYVALGHLHFHHTGSRRHYEKALNIVLGRQYITADLPLLAKIDTLQRAYGMGSHRIHQCLNFYLRMYVVELYLTYYKRLPSLIELDTEVCKHTPISEFQIAAKTSIHKDQSMPLVSETERESLIFYDPPLCGDILHYDFLSQKLSDLMGGSKI